ncbi:MAG: ADP-ribose pyrophosphatase [Thermotogaceae bacterium]|nr:ADP-ribose pyrophosphatase [Thermotogaceae bacterium]
MNQLFEKEIGRTYKFKGRIINLRVDEVILENGKMTEREVVEHNGAVAVLPIDSVGICTLVEQYRKPIEKVLLEVPAGKLDPGESPAKCALRELKEETGLAAEKLVPLGHIFTTAGFSNEKIHLFLALDLKQMALNPDEDEFLNVVKFHWMELIALAKSNELEDAKTNVLILRALPKVKKFLTDNYDEE